MSPLGRFMMAVDTLNEKVGAVISWMTLVMVLVQFVVVLMRYVFGLNSIFMQEAIVYMHALIFLAGSGFTLLHDGHVRVDVFYGAARESKKAAIDLLGVFFLLLPVCVLIFYMGWPFVASSWAVYEGSIEASGIQGVFLLKTAILVYAGLLVLQGLSLAVKCFFVLTGLRKTIRREIEKDEMVL